MVASACFAITKVVHMLLTIASEPQGRKGARDVLFVLVFSVLLQLLLVAMCLLVLEHDFLLLLAAPSVATPTFAFSFLPILLLLHVRPLLLLLLLQLVPKLGSRFEGPRS